MDGEKKRKKEQEETLSSAASVDDTEQQPAKKKSFWSEKHAVYIKGLPFTATVGEIENMLSDCGETKSIKQVVDPKSGRWTGSVNVIFKTKEALEAALTLDKTIWSGSGGDGVRFVTIVKLDQKAQKKRTQKNKDSASVFIGNLPEDVSEADVRAIFEPFLEACGSIRSVKLTMNEIAPSSEGTKTDKEKQSKCRGFGHVIFEYDEGQAAALKLNGRLGELRGKVPYVRKPTDPKAKKSKKEKKEMKDKKSGEGKKGGPHRDGGRDRVSKSRDGKK